MAFIAENLSTIIIGAAVLALVAFALVRTILNIRKGRSPCGCGCENCQSEGGGLSAPKGPK